jgi:hypothetical protein
MTDYKQLYEEMKEKQTTTFAMLLKIMEEAREQEEELEETKEELQTALIECDRFEGENEMLKENIMGLEEILDENGLLD